MVQIVVGSLMSRSAATGFPNTSLQELVKTLFEGKYSCVIIVDERRPVGIVTERDIVRLLHEALGSESDLAHLSAHSFMSASPAFVKETTPLFEALVITQTRGFRHLPVVDEDGYVSGILTFSDLAKAYENIIESQKAFIEEELGKKNKHLKQINRQLTAMSMEDALLGIGNRRSMKVDLDYTHDASRRYERSYAVALFDVDYFKAYNDYYGRQAGDETLIQVSNHLSALIRSVDRLYRYGGEELLLLMPETDFQGACSLVQRNVESLAQLGIEHKKSPLGYLSVSAGVSTPEQSPRARSWKGVVKQADKALYKAKSEGRNCLGIL